MWFFFNEGIGSLELGFVIAISVAALIGLTSGLFVTELRHPVVPRHPGHAAGRARCRALADTGLPAANVERRSRAILTEIIVGDFFVPTPFGDIRVYMSLVWFAFLTVILGYVLMASKFGNWIQAAGGNPLAATARGVRVGRTKVSLFILTACVAA